MKNKILILLIALTIVIPTFSQTKISNEAKIEADIIALETSGWDAWKNKDAEWFRTNTTEECLWINSGGMSTKAQMIKSVLTDCEVNSVLLDNFKFVMLNKNTILLTYTAIQDAVCNGEKIPTNIRASVNYINRDGKWLEAFYMETTIVE
jgi:hypothetical protein